GRDHPPPTARPTRAIGFGVARGNEHGRRTVGRRRDRAGGSGQQLGQAILVDHVPLTSASAASAGSAASRRLATCSRDFTVPGRRWIAVAILRSLSPEK